MKSTSRAHASSAAGVELSPAPPAPLTLADVIAACLTPAAWIGDEFLNYDPRDFPVPHMGVQAGHDLFFLSLTVAAGVTGIGVGALAWTALKAIALVMGRVQRPKYYPQERARRQELARARRRIRRRATLNGAPTPGELLEAWGRVKESPAAMIRFGSMLCDLEAYVDNSLVHDANGEIVGRRPGIRGWLREKCPELSARYKTVMSYKAMANKFRDAMGISDPYPAAWALDAAEDAGRGNAGRKNEAGEKERGETRGKREFKNTVRRDEIGEEMRRRVRLFLEECGANGTKKTKRAKETTKGTGVRRKMVSKRRVMVALDLRIHPEMVPREIEMEERRRQGLPARDGVLRRLVQRMA